MKKTFITTMPDKAGAFLTASKIISSLNGNITRVSYNKAIDVHTLFIDVSADKKTLDEITERLQNTGYLDRAEKPKHVMLVVFKLEDVPGAVKPVLEVLNKYDVNISYISSEENSTKYQYFKMGLLISDDLTVKNMLDEISKICELEILDYNPSGEILDNTVFYLSFANRIRSILNLTQEETNAVIADSNATIQHLGDNTDAQKAFSYIEKFASLLNKYKGNNYVCSVSKQKITERVTLFCILPPCGGNAYLLKDDNDLLLIDGGFACFKEETFNIIRTLIPNFDVLNKTCYCTHTDMDHVGLFYYFNDIRCNINSYEDFERELRGENNFREVNAKSAPYSRISRIISKYHTPDIKNVTPFNYNRAVDGAPLTKIHAFTFGDITFEVFEGNGGHVKGENIFISKDANLLFTGDIYVNIKGFSKEQAEFNSLAPFLMQSVDSDKELAKKEREALFVMIKDSPDMLICPGHGTPLKVSDIIK